MAETHLTLTVLHILLLSIALGGSCAQKTRKELRTKETNKDDHPIQAIRTDPSRVVQLSWQPRSGNPKDQRVCYIYLRLWPVKYFRDNFFKVKTTPEVYSDYRKPPQQTLKITITTLEIMMDVMTLSSGDRVFLYRDFLSDEESDYLISWVRGKGNYTVPGGQSINFSITMDSDDEITKIIEERIFAWTFLPKENSKSMNVHHFGSEDSTKKYSYFQNETIEQVDQPLLATVILYLSDVSQGGQIHFPQSEDKMWSDCADSNKIFKISKRNAIVVFNLHLNATPDRTSSHIRCPVLRDGMWCATKLFYLNSISSEKDLIQSKGRGCTDEDDNCPRWAAIGECQRNPVFMKGSPDYYGTCMKSCNAC